MAAAIACRVAAKTAAAAPATSTGTSTVLRHLRVVSCAATHEYPTYANVERLQARLQRELLSWKTAAAAAAATAAEEEDTTRTTSLSPKRPPQPPPPTLISFTPQPTYTLGRRQTAPLNDAERARLTAPLTMPSSPSPSPSSIPTSGTKTFTPAVTGAQRGGLATYHGPGQVVLWPVIDLRSPLHRGFSVRDYACLLEKTTIAALAKFGAGQSGGDGLRGFTTENPGVWVRRRRPGHGGGRHAQGDDERKISALGVHLRRHVTGLGVAVNFGMPVAGPEATNPWARIVACGLGDKGVTSIAAETAAAVASLSPEGEAGTGDVRHQQQADVIVGPEADSTAAEIANIWAAEFATRLGLLTTSATTTATGASPENGAKGSEIAASFSSPAVVMEHVIVKEGEGAGID
ncbi:lipoyl(octanoyl) transferase 2 [Microdochium nivale]|nr:lipoyl(octanoyl) transferase 2 [Microdochium nivale]